MAKSLVIVESPAKAKTVNHYLGSEYIVKASMGHVRDLPKGTLGVDIEHDFEPTYVIIPDRNKVVAEIKKAAQSCDTVILAADPDREGEAISWHLSQLIDGDKKKIFRAVFHEITREAIQHAFKHLSALDQNKIHAQQARRILDRLMGYLISPVLWKKVGRGLSAGRVQSVALRLICEREKEIKAFVAEEYWTIAAKLKASEPPDFRAALDKTDGKKAKVKTAEQAREIVDACNASPFILEKISVQEKKRHPAPPYITSSLQQDGFRLLRFPVKKTMFLAQKLYEGLEIGELGQMGLITYMRTDSVRVSEEARQAARRYIEQAFSAEYVPAKPPVYKTKKKSQDAHEAIRPAHLDLPPEKVRPYLKKEEFDLYKLIWNRFIASQMNPALVEETVFDIRASKYGFKAKGEVIKFRGFLALSPNGQGEADLLPKAKEGETLELLGLESNQKFTEPPSRYTEGSLVKELEAKGIGRPSTYAPIISTLQDRTYVTKDKGKFIPTDLGMFVTDFLVKYFSELVEVKFTAGMEEELDKINEGSLNWVDSLKRFYTFLEKNLKTGMATETTKKNGIPLEDKCPKCGRNLVIKEGRYGRFKACSGYPECKYKTSLVKKEAKPLDEKCPECESPLAVKYGKFGSFIACSSYPKCKYIKKENVDTGIPCPLNCGGTIIRRKTRRGKIFYGCSGYPKCTFATWDEPLARACPACGLGFVLRKNVLRGEPYLHCWNEKCAYKETVPQEKIWEKSAPGKDEKTDL
ncbi:MAG: type I DNA topoisomerase [Acidobacteriota bacterium]|nr:type I DNA topoisomerase [Acidobacteriota bacterium]